MKIMVAAAAFSPDISGIQRHALNLVRCLLHRTEIARVDLVVAPWQAKMTETLDDVRQDRLAIHVVHMRESFLGRTLWYYRELPAMVRQLQVDLVHLSYPVPVNVTAIPCPTVLSLHDLYPLEIPENFRFPQVIVNRLILRQNLRNASAIACVSKTTLHKLRHYVPGSAWQNAVHIYNCVEAAASSTELCPLTGWKDEPFLLCVAQHRDNKNILLLIRVFYSLLQKATTMPDIRLVVIGIDGPETQRIHQLIAQLKLDGQVLLLRGLSEPQLQWCYAHCEAVVAPSKTEGFGLPVAEALLAGARVVCSDIAAFREIGGEHCRYVTLGHNEDRALAKAIEETLIEPRGTCVALPQFSAEVLSHEYVSLYRRVLQLDLTAPHKNAPIALCPREKRFLSEQNSPAIVQSGRDEHGRI